MKFTADHLGIRRAKIRAEYIVTLDDLIILVAEAIAENNGKVPDNLTGRYTIENFVMMRFREHGSSVTERAGTFLIDDISASLCDEAEAKATELIIAFFPELKFDAPNHQRRWGENKRKNKITPA